MQTSNASKTFKIRKTKAKLLQQVQERQEVVNLNDIDSVRLQAQISKSTKQANVDKDQETIRVKQYLQDQQDINCCRFPHSSFCGCVSNCVLQSFDPIQILTNLSYGNFVTGLKTKHLLEIGVTHILNVTSKQYTKRQKYFEYLNIDLHYNTEQDAKKFFRLTNRFIKDAIKDGGRVFVHASVLELGAIMTLGYLIGVQKISFKQGLARVLKNGLQLTPHFLKQLQSYDLEKMAFVSIQRE